MRTSAEAFIEAVRSGAVKAWADGDPIEWSNPGYPWKLWRRDAEVPGETPQFGHPDFYWRIPPTKRRVPFTQSSIPKNALFRIEAHPNGWVLLSGYCQQSAIAYGIHVPYNELADQWEMSLDNGATWQPASEEVES